MPNRGDIKTHEREIEGDDKSANYNLLDVDRYAGVTSAQSVRNKQINDVPDAACTVLTVQFSLEARANKFTREPETRKKSGSQIWSSMKSSRNKANVCNYGIETHTLARLKKRIILLKVEFYERFAAAWNDPI